MIAGPPVARVIAVHVDRRGVRSVVVDCPFGCRRGHVHGWRDGDLDVGTRVAHCPSAYNGAAYRVVGGPAVLQLAGCRRSAR